MAGHPAYGRSRTTPTARRGWRQSAAVLVLTTVAVVAGPGVVRAQASDAIDDSVVGDAGVVVVEDPLLRSRDHHFTSIGDIVGNDHAFLASRFTDCGTDCLQLLRSADGLAWELIVIDGPGRWIRDLVADDDGFAALVVDGPPANWPNADNTWYVYQSQDGLTWSGSAIEPTRSGDLLSAITTGPGGYVAAGCDTRLDQLGERAQRGPFCRQAVVWSSADGSTWEREELGSGRLVELTSVAMTGDTVVVAGADFPDGRNKAGKPAVFARSDGGRWSRTEPTGLDRGLLVVHASPRHGLVLAPAVDWDMLAHGNMDFDAPISERYASEDGVSWAVLPGPPAGAGSSDSETRLTSVAEHVEGTVVIASTRTRQGGRGSWRESSRMWREDGETWRSLAIPQRGFAEDGGVLLAVGPEGRALMASKSGAILVAGPHATDPSSVVVGPVPGRAAIPISPLGYEAQAVFLSMNAVEPGACSIMRRRDIRRWAPAAVSGLGCAVGDDGRRVRHFLFSDATEVETWWREALKPRDRLDVAEMDDVITRCADGATAWGGWQTDDGRLSGAVVCHALDDEAVVAWITPSTFIGSELRAEAGELASLMASFAPGRISVPSEAASRPETDAAGTIPKPEPIDSQARQRSEAVMRNALRPFACKPWREEDEPFMFGAGAAVQCSAPAPGVSQLALFRFDDADDLGSFWVWRRAQLSPLLDWEAACQDGREGVTSWAHGSAACFVKREGRDVARIRWTDTRTDTYGVLDATSADLPALVAWWEANDPSSLAPMTLKPAEKLDDRLPADTAGQLRYLRQRVTSPSRCRPMGATALARSEPGAIAGLACTPTPQERNRYGMRSLRYFLFPSSRSMTAWWDTARADATPGGVARDSGSIGMCTNMFSEIAVETGWISRDRSRRGRLLCVPRLGVRWTVSPDLVAGETDAAAWWFPRAHPERVQHFRRLGLHEKPHRPFVPPQSLRPLPADIGQQATGQDVYVGRPQSGRGLSIGVVYPLSLGHCDGLGFAPDVDGSFWQITGGVDPDGTAVKRNLGWRVFGEGDVVEFLKTGKDRAQLRTESGYVFGYERHPGKRRFYPCA